MKNNEPFSKTKILLTNSCNEKLLLSCISAKNPQPVTPHLRSDSSDSDVDSDSSDMSDDRKSYTTRAATKPSIKNDPTKGGVMANKPDGHTDVQGFTTVGASNNKVCGSLLTETLDS